MRHVAQLFVQWRFVAGDTPRTRIALSPTNAAGAETAQIPPGTGSSTAAPQRSFATRPERSGCSPFLLPHLSWYHKRSGSLRKCNALGCPGIVIDVCGYARRCASPPLQPVGSLGYPRFVSRTVMKCGRAETFSVPASCHVGRRCCHRYRDISAANIVEIPAICVGLFVVTRMKNKTLVDCGSHRHGRSHRWFGMVVNDRKHPQQAHRDERVSWNSAFLQPGGHLHNGFLNLILPVICLRRPLCSNAYLARTR